MTPERALQELAEKAQFDPSRQFRKLKPGEFYNRRATVEEQEAIKQLTSEDLRDIRPDCIFPPDARGNTITVHSLGG